MKTDKTENDYPIGEHYPLADTPEERRKQYEQAVRFSERFQNQYGPQMTDYEDLTKITEWIDENGKRQRTTKALSLEEKEALDDAREIIDVYEEHYIDEYHSIVDANEVAPAKDIEQSVEDMQVIRSRNEPSQTRKKEFESIYSQSADEKEPDIREIREAKLEKAFTRLAQFELQNAPALTSQSGNEKHIVSFNGDGAIDCKIEIIAPEEVKELDEALAVVREIEAVDEDLVNYMENYVFDLEKERIGMETPNTINNKELTDEQIEDVMGVQSSDTHIDYGKHRVQIGTADKEDLFNFRVFSDQEMLDSLKQAHENGNIPYGGLPAGTNFNDTMPRLGKYDIEEDLER